MMARISTYFTALFVLQLAGPGAAADLSEISNFRQYSPTFASSGQPDKDQLGALKAAGFERIVYIAMSDSRNALANEDVVVKELGMDYIHVPVIWDQPTTADFYAFAGAMQQQPDRKTLLHCQVNYRASAFSFLYRVLYEDVPLAEAKADMNSVWTPNETWKNFIFAILEENGHSPHCDGCDWSTD